MSAIAPKSGPMRQLDRPSEPDELVTTAEVQEPDKLARRLMTALKDIATLKRRFWPEHIDFEDVTVDATGTTPNRFPHGFNGRVRWWIVDWVATSTGTEPNLWRDSDGTTDKVLVLFSGAAGVLTLRVEEAG